MRFCHDVYRPLWPNHRKPVDRPQQGVYATTFAGQIVGKLQTRKTLCCCRYLQHMSYLPFISPHETLHFEKKNRIFAVINFLIYAFWKSAHFHSLTVTKSF